MSDDKPTKPKSEPLPKPKDEVDLTKVKPKPTKRTT